MNFLWVQCIFASYALIHIYSFDICILRSYSILVWRRFWNIFLQFIIVFIMFDGSFSMKFIINSAPYTHTLPTILCKTSTGWYRNRLCLQILLIKKRVSQCFFRISDSTNDFKLETHFVSSKCAHFIANAAMFSCSKYISDTFWMRDCGISATLDGKWMDGTNQNVT